MDNKIPTKFRLSQGLRKPAVVVEIGNDWLKVMEGTPFGQEGVVTKGDFKNSLRSKRPVTVALVKIFKDMRLNTQGLSPVSHDVWAP